MVCAFATEQQLEEGLDTTSTALRAGLAATSSYVNHSCAQVRFLLVDNYAELETKLNGLLASTCDYSSSV